MKERFSFESRNRAGFRRSGGTALLLGRASLVLLVMLLSLDAHAADPGSPLPGDLGRLQGRWTASVGPNRDIGVILEINGRAVTVDISTPRGHSLQVEGELTLDETTHPRSLAWTKFMAAGEQPLPEIRGVYKIEGDTFTVCNGGFRGTRPKEFKRGDHPLADLVIFQRIRSARPEARSTAATRQSLTE